MTDFSGVFQWIMAHGYFLMFVAMLIEGPIVTAAAAFASAFGYFNIAIVFALSIFGDLVADIIYYALGYFSRGKIIEKYGRYIGLSKERIEQAEYHLSKHGIKTLIVLKLAPVIPTPGLMLVGAIRMPLKKFIISCLLVTLPRSILFMIIGYYFGRIYTSIMHYVNYGAYAFIGGIALACIVYYVYKKISGRIADKIEKI